MNKCIPGMNAGFGWIFSFTQPMLPYGILNDRNRLPEINITVQSASKHNLLTVKFSKINLQSKNYNESSIFSIFSTRAILS